jgi:hypothetical protein
MSLIVFGARSRMAVRVATALAGGYAAAAALATLLARLLPIARVEATAWGMMISFALYGALLLWAFHERRLGRVAGVIWSTAILGAALLWALGVRP